MSPDYYEKAGITQHQDHQSGWSLELGVAHPLEFGGSLCSLDSILIYLSKDLILELSRASDVSPKKSACKDRGGEPAKQVDDTWWDRSPQQLQADRGHSTMTETKTRNKLWPP